MPAHMQAAFSESGMCSNLVIKLISWEHIQALCKQAD